MIVITAPTSKIGRQVLDNILDTKEEIRVIARDPSRLSERVRARVGIIQGSHADRDVVDAAFDGADSVFWLVPANPKAQSVYDAYVQFSIPAADAVVKHHVERIVIVSALGRGQQLYGGHMSASWAMEDLFRSTGANVRALTMPSFMDNMLWQVHSIKNDGVIRFTIPGHLKAPWVATRDIAEVASRLLLDHDWIGQNSLPVLGSENLSLEEMAEILSEVLGKPVRFVQGNREEYKQSFLSYGYSEAMAQSMVDMDIAIERDVNNGIQRTLENTTPTSFRQWAEEVLKPAYDAL
ncbi:hypothetical protein N007_21190 [Alicyclobacillus acidoterrestris ATCC 49025]|nr:hypothetical protein N007_21190 [Alicyclobacillus acidoterrestris ATCC 49025]